MGKTQQLGTLVNGLTVDADGNVGIATTPTTDRLTISGNTTVLGSVNVSSYQYFTSIYGGYIFGYTGTTYTPMTYSASYHSFSTSGTEKLRITNSGNVGIGTSSPAEKLHVSEGIVRVTSSTTGINIHPNADFGAGSLPTIQVYTNHALQFATNNSLRMTITSGGNVGIGTSSPDRKLTIGGTTSAYMNFNPTSYRNYVIGSDDLGFILYDNFNSAYRMVVNSSGQVGIGTTTPTATRVSLGTGIGAKFMVYDNPSLGVYSGLGQDLAGGNSIDLFAHGYANYGYITFGKLGTNGTSYSEWMRITPSGYVGIGTTNPVSKLTIIRDSPFNTGEQALRIRAIDGDGYNLWMGASVNGYATIQSYRDNFGGATLLINPLNGGNVSIGTTVSTYRLNVAKVSQAAPALMISGAFYGGPRIQTYGLDADPNAWMGLGTDMGGNAYEHSLYYSTNGRQTIGSYDGSTYTTRFYILANGNYWFSGSNLSDVRLKENIQPITLTASEKIALLNPCSYNMKDDLSVTKYGFIAQEVQSILPDLIRGGSDNNEDYMGLDYDGVFTITVKAVQEILVRLTALENK